MLTTQCPNCRSKKIHELFSAKNTQYYQCEKCTIVYADELATTEYSSYHRFEEYQRWHPYLDNHFSWVSQQLDRLKTGRKVILEIGSSVGYLMAVLSRRGNAVVGVEPSLNAVEFARKSGLNVVHGYFEDAKIPDMKFDMIVANHVFEHIHNPDLFVNKAADLLKKKSGYLVLLLPNFGSLEAKLMKSRWRFLIPDEHYMQYTPISLTDTLERRGFRVVKVLTTTTVTGLSDYKKEYIRCLKHDKKRMLFYILESPWALFQLIFGKGTNLCLIARIKT